MSDAVAVASQPLAPVANSSPTPWAALTASWEAYSTRQLKPRVLTTYSANVSRFLRFLGPTPVHAVVEANLWDFIDAELKTCGNLRTMNVARKAGVFCHAGVFPWAKVAPSSCGLTCPKYEPRNPLVIHHALKSLNSFFRFLVRRGHVPRNPVPDVTREFTKDYPPRKYMNRRRQPTLDEVRKLVVGTPHPARRALYLLLAKTGFRIHEVALLHIGTDCLDLDAKTVRIPNPKTGPNKRRGKRLGFIDDELERVLRSYLDYRAGLLARRSETARPLALFLSCMGLVGLGSGVASLSTRSMGFIGNPRRCFQWRPRGNQSHPRRHRERDRHPCRGRGTAGGPLPSDSSWGGGRSHRLFSAGSH